MPSATSRPTSTTFTTADGFIRQGTECRQRGTKLRVFKNTLSGCPGLLDHYNIVVTLKTKNEFMPVHAYLGKEYEAVAASLRKGQKIVNGTQELIQFLSASALQI